MTTEALEDAYGITLNAQSGIEDLSSTGLDDLVREVSEMAPREIDDGGINFTRENPTHRNVTGSSVLLPVSTTDGTTSQSKMEPFMSGGFYAILIGLILFFGFGIYFSFKRFEMWKQRKAEKQICSERGNSNWSPAGLGSTKGQRILEEEKE